MKIAESWLREWVDPQLASDELAHQLTMLGHEVDDVATEGAGLDGVCIAEVVSFAKHPDADRLNVCQVSVGGEELLEVVCGAPNVAAGMKSPLATPGVKLPNGVKLRKSKIRGVVSNGMLCSAVELGLGEESDGIIELPADAPLGKPLSDYLELPDTVFDIDLTPNRGDCFSTLGIARDIAALTGAELTDDVVESPAAEIDAVVDVQLPEPDGCPVFAGRLIKGIDPNATTPLWMVERLRRVGLRAIHPVVDITNYVMMEYGQPLHGYDADKLKGAIRPRRSTAGETLTLLDEKSVELHDGTMVITDDSGVIGLAGIMGGLSTAVSDATCNVFFEGAFWPQDVMAGQARSYGMHTDASLRFERGVDPAAQGRAVDRATQLLLEIAGGQAGPLNVVSSADHIPQAATIDLRSSRLNRVLGCEIDGETVEKILKRLQMSVTSIGSGWRVTPPSYRFDVSIEADLIEEVARIVGYDNIPATTATSADPLRPVTETRISESRLAATLAARDYQEAITYSFISASANDVVTGEKSTLELRNPISSEMSVMRASLLPGLIDAATKNLARQAERVRIFELGKTFHGVEGQHVELLRIAGLICGPAVAEQWGRDSTPVDFFDIKSDVESLLQLALADEEFSFVAGQHTALQPGQTASVVRGEQPIGFVGKLHPNVAKHFALKTNAFVFELNADALLQTSVPSAEDVSRFPAIRRDIAVLVAENVTANQIVSAIKTAAPSGVTNVKIFDVYQGPGIEAGLKSVAIGLILQDTSRTLTDDEADAAQAAAVQKLQQEFAAVLRD